MSLKDLMHSMIGMQPNISAINAINNGSTLTHQGMLAQHIASAQRHSTNKKVFHGMVEVNQVANGYIVTIGTREGYEYETHIASSITEVNEIIAAQIVAFKLEDKS